jgi:hypothetical protein
MTRETQVRIFGDYKENATTAGEYLTIGFSPSFLPLKKRWKHNGLSADFIADYFRNFYISRKELDDSARDLENLCDAVKYIANELLENAMKFQDAQRPYSARIFLSLHLDELIFTVTNGVTPVHAQALQAYIEKLLQHDPQDLYVQAMRASIKTENQDYSGFGLLSMLCDYSAKLGWKISYCPVPENSAPLITVTTVVILKT